MGKSSINRDFFHCHVKLPEGNSDMLESREKNTSFRLVGLIDMGVSENSVPLHPMVLLIIIPFLNGYFIGNIPNIFRQTHIDRFTDKVRRSWKVAAPVRRRYGHP